jgi:Polyketide cyclase / dehydrase and lipid transport
VETYDLTVHAAAPPDAVFAVLADATRWHEWAGFAVATSEWEREGEPPPGGVGAIRKLGRAPMYGREQITEYGAPVHLAYTILSGIPVRGYHADIDLLADETGTTIRWTAAFEPKIPGTGALLAAMLRRTVLGYARAAALEAERRVRSP